MKPKKRRTVPRGTHEAFEIIHDEADHALKTEAGRPMEIIKENLKLIRKIAKKEAEKLLRFNKDQLTDKLMELDALIHAVVTKEALKGEKGDALPFDRWLAILYSLLRYCGTRRAKEVLGYEASEREVGSPLCSCKALGCKKHCSSCRRPLKVLSNGVRPVHYCKSCDITFRYINVPFEGKDSWHVLNRCAHVNG
jgi:hypothetical protein